MNMDIYIDIYKIFFYYYEPKYSFIYIDIDNIKTTRKKSVLKEYLISL